MADGWIAHHDAGGDAERTDPETKINWMGFRCAQDAKEEPPAPCPMWGRAGNSSPTHKYGPFEERDRKICACVSSHRSVIFSRFNTRERMT